METTPALPTQQPACPYPELEQRIANLRRVGLPLAGQRRNTPLLTVIARIRSLPSSLAGMEVSQKTVVEQEVRECERILAELSCDYVAEIITRPSPSRIFRILRNADRFRQRLAARTGHTVDLSDGSSRTLSDELCQALCRHSFSIGSPPVTPQGVRAIEEMVIGGPLVDVARFGDLMGGDPVSFDRLVTLLHRMVDQSTQYTTAQRIDEFLDEATDLVGFEGARGLLKTVVTGDPLQLIRERLLGRHGDGTAPCRFVEGVQDLGDPEVIDRLIFEMGHNKDKLFVLKVDGVPHNTFSDAMLQQRWRGVIGRLILVDMSLQAQKTGVFLVYSLQPFLIEALRTYHVKEYGTPASTQLNLRLLLSRIPVQTMAEIIERLAALILHLRRDAAPKDRSSRARRWQVEALADCLMLEQLHQLLCFVHSIQTAPDLGGVLRMGEQLAAAVEEKAWRYFFAGLERDSYEVICVPQGGGRRELGLIARFVRRKLDSAGQELVRRHLDSYRQRLAEMKHQLGIERDDTQVSAAAARLALAGRQEPDQVLMAAGDDEMRRRNGHRSLGMLGRGMHRMLSRIEDGLERAARLEEVVTGLNLPGALHRGVLRCLEALQLERGAKHLERRGGGAAERLWHRPLGWLHRSLDLAGWQRRVAAARRQLEPVSVALAETILQALEGGTWAPILVLPEVGWTFSDVFVEDEFPEKDYLNIPLDDKGRPDMGFLETHLESMAERLQHFPELFRFYCSSLLLIVNDPHNPTSRVADHQTKLALLRLASTYGLTLIADEAYHKLVSREVKQRQGDLPLAMFLQRHRSRIKGPVTLYTTLPSTKWAMGGGRRTGVILTNDRSTVNGHGFSHLVASEERPGNLLSLYFDLQSLQTGLAVKQLCRALQQHIVAAVNRPAGELLDELLDPFFAGDQDHGQPQYPNRLAPLLRALVRARNQLLRLELRHARELDRRRHIDRLVRELEGFRLEKLTLRDTARRTEVVRQALDRTGFEGRYIVPQGPFYVCLRLDPAGDDADQLAFLETLALHRKIDAVPVGKGWIRFAFGGPLDGSDGSYELLGVALETDLRVLFHYWQEYQQRRRGLNEAGDTDPASHALQSLFDTDDNDLARLIEEKRPLLEHPHVDAHRLAAPVVRPFQPGEYPLLAKIEPGSPATVVTVAGGDCRGARELLQSRTFAVLYNHLICRVAAAIPELRGLTASELIGTFGADFCRTAFEDRQLEEQELRLFRQLLLSAARLWFSANTIKVLVAGAHELPATAQADFLLGREARISRQVLELLRAFVTEEQERTLPVRACFQVGVVTARSVRCGSVYPGWLQQLVEGLRMASELVATDESPDLVTGGTRRAGAHELGIFRRDGDGTSAPDAQFFRSRLEHLVTVLGPGDYLGRLLQVGPTRILVVLHRAWSHYLPEELRLFPQFSLEKLLAAGVDGGELRPDGVAFLGIPRKVMGEGYRIGFFLDHTSDGRQLPVSWVSAGDDADYMGYFKKPILTLHNQVVHQRGGLPVHGSLLTITLRNGLRKTLVLAGDSGTGKSELLIAMTQQMMDLSGGAREIESIELLAGDMLSLFIGEDGQLYAFGTESGDFLRMTDIPTSWQRRFRDRIAAASTTNRHDPKNPRTTISGLCEPHKLLAPTRVNLFFVMDNFTTPPQGERALVREEEPQNLLLQILPEGWRREKGTSGDQPSLRASLLHSDHPQRQRLLDKHQDRLDALLVWQVRQPDRPAVLAFADLPGEIDNAREMVRDLFCGQILDAGDSELRVLTEEGESVILAAGSYWRVSGTRYAVADNRFGLDLVACSDQETRQDGDRRGKQKLRARLDRLLFDRLLPPIAATFCGNPFVDPRGMGSTLRRFARVMASTEVVTGVVHTQLAVTGKEREGPAQASRQLLQLIQEHPRIIARFQRNKARVYRALQQTYGEALLGPVDLPVQIQAINLLELERFESDTIRLVDEHDRHIDLVTPHYRFSPEAVDEPQTFVPRLLHPRIKQAMRHICSSPDFDIELDDYRPALGPYRVIRHWHSMEELAYQVLLVHGDVTLGHGPEHLYTAPSLVRKAWHIAELLEQRRDAAPTQALGDESLAKPTTETITLVRQQEENNQDGLNEPRVR